MYRNTTELDRIILNLGDIKRMIDKDKTSQLYYSFQNVWDKLMIVKDKIEREIYSEEEEEISDLENMVSELEWDCKDKDCEIEKLKDEIKELKDKIAGLV